MIIFWLICIAALMYSYVSSKEVWPWLYQLHHRRMPHSVHLWLPCRIADSHWMLHSLKLKTTKKLIMNWSVVSRQSIQA